MEVALAVVLTVLGFGLSIIGPLLLGRGGRFERGEGRGALRWIVFGGGMLYAGGIVLLAEVAGMRTAIIVGVGLLILIEVVMVPFYVRDYRRATRRARAQREARARRRAADP